MYSSGYHAGINNTRTRYPRVSIDKRLASEPIVNVVIKYRPLGLTC